MRSTDWANPACSVWDSKQCKISKYVHRNTPLQHWWVPAAWCSQIKHYTVVLFHPFRPRSNKAKLSRKRGSPSSWVNGKNSWPLCPSQQCSHILWLSLLDRVDPAGRAKQIHEEWDCVTSCNQVSWIDHRRLNETEQQSAIFKVIFKLCCIKLKLSVI